MLEESLHDSLRRRSSPRKNRTDANAVLTSWAETFASLPPSGLPSSQKAAERLIRAGAAFQIIIISIDIFTILATIATGGQGYPVLLSTLISGVFGFVAAGCITEGLKRGMNGPRGADQKLDVGLMFGIAGSRFMLAIYASAIACCCKEETVSFVEVWKDRRRWRRQQRVFQERPRQQRNNNGTLGRSAASEMDQASAGRAAAGAPEGAVTGPEYSFGWIDRPASR